MEINKIEQGCFNELTIDNGTYDPNNRLTRKHKLAFRNGIDRKIQSMIAQKVKKSGLKEASAARRRNTCQVADIVIFKYKIFNEIRYLTNTARNGIAAIEGILAEKRGKTGLVINHARFPVPLCHSEFVEIRIQTYVGRFGAIG